MAGPLHKDSEDMSMRVLDIDLDFFLKDCCPLAEPGKRPALNGHEPWNTEEVRSFLENNLHLSKNRPVPGTVFETHDGALRFWNEKIRSGELSIPFHVTHVDAHSDLGIGKPGPGYVLNGVLPLKPEIRADLDKYYTLKQLDEANYLLFALAFRWIRSLDNIRNPKSRRDFPEELRSKNGDICLTSFPAKLMEGSNGTEPVIVYREYADYRAYAVEEPFDYMTVAVSPRYAPEEADGLLPLLMEYIQ